MKKSIKYFLIILVIIMIVIGMYFIQLKSLFVGFLVTGQPSENQQLLDAQASINASTTNSKDLLQFVATANNLASTTNLITVKDCIATPTSTKIKYGEHLLIHNTGQEDLSLTVGSYGIVQVPALKRINLASIDIVSKTRVTGSVSNIAYFCKGKTGPIGFITVSN